MNLDAIILKSLYDYKDGRDPKCLNFEADERFALIKEPDGADWYYVVNSQGQIGYVPKPYVNFDGLTPRELLALIDSIASKLDLKNQDANKLLTDRQIKHAQIKLAGIRCEITQTLIKEEPKSSSPKPPIITELSAIKEDIKSELDEMELPARACLGDDVISENLVSNLIENVKLDATLSEDKAIIVANSVIKTLSENIQPWSLDCKKILEIMEKYVNEKVNSENVYSAKLKCIFKRLWYCKNDTQQRNWPVYEDEDIINGYMDELLSLLLNTDQRITPDFFLTTVLPSELAVEMQNYLSDKERWIKASTLFTLIFSSGHKPSVNIYEHLNENFFSRQFDLIEGFDINGQAIECDIQPESIISPILSFNLHINDTAENVIFKALRKRSNASHFTENLISYLNWEEDIILTSCAFQRNTENDSVPNSVLKFLTEMFADKVVSSLFYYNDVRVIIDIIISQLDNLPVGDNRIKNYLELTNNILKNTQYAEEPHKTFELKKCLQSIQHHEFSNQADIVLAQDIFERFQEIFNYGN
ncbi:PREDICTED: NCK-interacting protein with SH3 domain-like [Rhagoletis zephyria]|uniref:NCK-interacting protein with SH3 domain-like n=1 Tax=Rhagoletis zephyria TaxID=28612 RepID=UPI0008117BE9|nr:PREDICTED: NCK-interacting protein with SH3 domain-like [Rhagoletis zephyria]